MDFDFTSNIDTDGTVLGGTSSGIIELTSNITGGIKGENGADGTNGIDGIDGTNGTNGIDGVDGAAATIAVGTVSTLPAGGTASVTNAGTSSAAIFDIAIPQGANGTNGTNGTDGTAATIAVGTVTTGAAGSSATVTNAGTSAAAVFNMTIPRGDKGDTGDTGVGVLINTTLFAQSGLTGSGISTLTGLVNGSNTTFTVPTSSYEPLSLQVYLNGVLQVPGDAVTETTPASGIFTFTTAPVTGDQLYVVYLRSSNADEEVLIPAGGTTGQVLSKVSATDYDTTWATPSGGGGGVTDHTLLTNIGTNTHAQIDTALATSASHIADTANPHSVTKTQVGLGSVDNTSDLAKPVSTATQTALDGKAATSHSHTAANVTDFDTEVANNTDVAANTAARHTHTNSAVLAATTASFLLADETKLDGIAAGATANSSDATLLARANHTGTQTASTISDFSTAADARVVAASRQPFRVSVTRDSTRPATYTCDGTADDVQIQAAVDAVNAAGGGTVLLLAGTNAYRIAATIALPENVSLIGERMARQSAGGTILKTAASVTLTNMFTMTGTTNPTTNANLKHDVHIENITFEGNNTTTNAFMLTNQDTIKFINCRFITSTNSINTTWDHTTAPTASNIPGGIYLERCNISTTGTGIGVTLNYQTQCWISNCWFTASSGTPTAWIKFNCSNKVKVTNCEFNTATNALWFTDVNTASALDYPCHNLNISGCAFANGTGVINDDRTHAGSGYVQINGSMASGTTAGDTLVGSGNSAILGTTNYTSGTISVDTPTAAAHATTKTYVDARTPQVTVGTTAPGSPATGDLWVDTN